MSEDTARSPIEPPGGPYRGSAVRHWDLSLQVDDQFRLLRPRRWWGLIGAALMVAALVVWAAFTPTVAAVSAPARALAPGGVVPVNAPATGMVLATGAVGTTISRGQPVIDVRGARGRSVGRAPIAATVWEVLAPAGASVRAGQTALTLLPPSSDRHALALVPEEMSAAVAPGQSVLLDSATTATVSEVSPPLPRDVARNRTGLAPQSPGKQVVVTMDLATALPPGTEHPAVIITSRQSVLDSLVP